MTQCHDYGHYHQIVDRSAHDEWKQANPGTPLAADPHAGALAGEGAPPAGGDTGDWAPTKKAAKASYKAALAAHRAKKSGSAVRGIGAAGLEIPR